MINFLRGQTLKYWKDNAEEEYIKTPISVLKYIIILEEIVDKERLEIILKGKCISDKSCEAAISEILSESREV